MRLIVFSRVLKYKAIYIGAALLLILAFFQSNQALGEFNSASEAKKSNTPAVGLPETPSTPETPDKPEAPDLPDSDNSTTKINIVIKTSTNTNSSGINHEPDEETTIEQISREATDESISITFKSNGEEQNIKEKIEGEVGKTSVKFKTKSTTKSKSEISQETNIEKESSTH